MSVQKCLIIEVQNLEMSFSPLGMVEITSGIGGLGMPIVTMEEGTKVWHLVKHDDGMYISRTQKVISEIFLTRLLTTKV